MRNIALSVVSRFSPCFPSNLKDTYVARNVPWFRVRHCVIKLTLKTKFNKLFERHTVIVETDPALTWPK